MKDREEKVMSDNTSVATEVARWFFDDYLPTWEAVGNGSLDRKACFILDYWGIPLFEYHPDGGEWALDGDSVTALLNATHTRLKKHHYTHTEVVDSIVRSYHRNGAAIEVIWSRRRGDDTEIERLAVHFEVVRTQQGWRIAGIQLRSTTAQSLTEAWSATDRDG